MKQTYNGQTSHKRDWGQIMVLALLLVLMSLVFEARAQEGSVGNTYIFGGAEMGFFGNHNFVTGGSGTQPGIVGTQRSSGSGFGVLGYSESATTITGANDANHVDGYVRKYSSTDVKFTFPVGDNGVYRPFAANPANQVVGAYFRANPTTAVTSDLGGGSYGPLPGGGTFPITSRGASVSSVFDKGYWDIDGASAAQITLSWDNTIDDDITTFTGSTLAKLTIVGWNPTTSKWERIPSTVDATSLFGVASSLTQGSITSDATVIPSDYTVYTLAVATPDLTPNITVTPSVITGNAPITISVDVYEINNIPTNGGLITLNTKVDPAWTIGITPGAVINGWTYVGVVGINHRFTSNAVIQFDASSFSFPATFNSAGKIGQFTFLITILSNSGGESPNTNNSDQETVSYQP